VKCIKDEEGRVLVQERDIKDRWKKYFHTLFNEGFEVIPVSYYNVKYQLNLCFKIIINNKGKC